MKNKLSLFAGILGGGQLAWMLNLSAEKFGIRTRVWDTTPAASGFRGATEIYCSPWDSEKGGQSFCQGLDFCTLEWESIPSALLKRVTDQGVELMPSADAVKKSSSRILERQLFARLGFALAPWMMVDGDGSLTPDSWNSFWQDETFDKVFLKHDRGGYDGKGQVRIEVGTPFADVKNFFELGDARGIVEAHADLMFEVSVVASRNRSGQIAILGLFENEHENGVLRVTRLVADDDTRFDRQRAIKNMISLLTETQYVGTAALELFVEKSGRILVNEWAPRVHNSGHISLDTYEESQFDFHWRALADLEFPDNPVKRRGIMINVLADDLSGDVSFTRSAILDATDPMPFLALHLKADELRAVRNIVPYDYGKKQLKPGRKMGHLNVLF